MQEAGAVAAAPRRGRNRWLAAATVWAALLAPAVSVRPGGHRDGRSANTVSTLQQVSRSLAGIQQNSYATVGAYAGVHRGRSLSFEDHFDLLPGVLSEEDGTLFYVHASEHRSFISPKSPPVLTIAVSLRAMAHTLEFSMPPGYLPSPLGNKDKLLDCAIDFSATAGETLGELSMQALAQHVLRCEASTVQDPKEPARIVVRLKREVPGLSRELASSPEGHTNRTIWYFKVQVTLPKAAPSSDLAYYEMKWRSGESKAWEGSIAYKATPLLGDWDCLYSDWEGWGECSARCGGGEVTLRRRILAEPPEGSSGKACTGSLSNKLPCNTHDCPWPCVDKGPLESKEQRAKCTAKCGGGVQVHRRKMVGDHCLVKEEQFMDLHAVELETCNEDACKIRCVHSALWRAATECSELCGQGFFWMLREVVQKDPTDNDCVPMMRKQDCIRQHCAGFAVVHPNRNIQPRCGQSYEIGIVIDGTQIEHYKTLGNTESIRVLRLTAPKGYSFGAPNSACNIYESDMPSSPECIVGADANMLTLTLDPSVQMPSKQQFRIEIEHPACDKENTKPDESMTAIYQVTDSPNRWLLDLMRDSTNPVTVNAAGYEMLYSENLNPETFLSQDWTACTGRLQLMLEKRPQGLCVDKLNRGDRTSIVLRTCPADDSKLRWIVPPTGDGTIMLFDKMTECICVGDGEPAFGSRLQLDDCNKRQCRWEMPSGIHGDIRLDSDSKLCMSVVGGPAEDGAELGLGACTHPTFEALQEWQTPCPSVPELRDYTLSPQSGSSVIVRREPPLFCSIRKNCVDGMTCDYEEGICTTLTAE